MRRLRDTAGFSCHVEAMRKGAPEHSSRDFETELRELTAHVLAMGARCERIVRQAFEGYRRGLPDICQEVIALDARIDQDEMDLHALVMRMLALRQPVADDLRRLAATLRLITDLERVGDEAVNIAERAVHDDGGAKEIAIQELVSMEDAALDMLHRALAAFVHEEVADAGDVLTRDDEVDLHCAHVIGAVSAWVSEHGSEAPSGLRAICVAKFLERIADHATNIAEEAIFLVRGEDVRHGAWRQVEPEVPSQAFRS
jgi:phosphate transport system protein